MGTNRVWSREQVASEIRKAARITGELRLRSGKPCDHFWDNYRFQSDPHLLTKITLELSLLLPGRYDRLAGLDLGGVPLVTALSLMVGKPALYIRREAHDYGLCNLAEGGFEKGDMVVVIDDVVTSAGRVITTIKKLREHGLNVEHVLCVIDREQGGLEALKEIDCSLHSAFKMTELAEAE